MKRARLFLSVILLAGIPLAVSAQTDTLNVSTNAPAAAVPTDLAAPDSDPATIPAGMAPGRVQTTTPDEEIADIRPPFFFLHSWLWLWIALAAVALLALALLLWQWLKPNRLLSPKTAYELTLEKLEKARALLQEENPMPYAVSVSEAIRSYLGQRFQTPSTRRTTEEFLRQMDDDKDTPLAEHRGLLREFLQSCDLVKFAQYRPALAELEQVQDSAVSFVTATKPAPTAPTPRKGGKP